MAHRSTSRLGISTGIRAEGAGTHSARDHPRTGGSLSGDVSSFGGTGCDEIVGISTETSRRRALMKRNGS
jgi:hypothetical protein